MTVTIANQWTAVGADTDIELITKPTPGNWLVALVTCRVVDGSAPLLSLGDVSRNVWTLLQTDTLFANSSNGSAQLQAEVWACPAARYDGWPGLIAYITASQITASDVGSICVDVVELAGMGNNWLTVDSITSGQAAAATSLSIAVPAPAGGQSCVMLAAAATDNASGTVTATGAGFAALTQVTRTAPNLTMTSQWQVSTAPQTAAWSSTAAANWSGIAVALRVTGAMPAQPNPAWPLTQFQVGLGYNLSTPLPRVRWTDQMSRLFSLSGDRGIQAELGASEQGTTDLVIRDDDGAYEQRPVATSAPASAAGTTTTVKILDANAANIHRADFFRLATAAGALKELNVFQVVSTSSAGGTTTVTFMRADGTGGGALAATAAGDLYLGIQIDLYIPFRLLMTQAGKTYGVSSGWMRDLPVVYTAANWAEVNAEAGDAIETLTAASPSALGGEILRRPNLYAYWPLNDAQGTGYAQNASQVTSTTLTQVASKWGVGASASADFGAATQDIQTAAGPPAIVTSLYGDTGTGWAQAGGAAAEIPTKGWALVGADPNFPPVSGGVTVFGCLLAPDVNPILNTTLDPTVMVLKTNDPGAGTGGAVIKIAIDHVTPGTPLQAKVVVWDKTTHASTTTVCGDQITSSDWLSWALTFNQTSWSLYVNGHLSGSGTCNLVSRATILDIGGEADQFHHSNFFNATHAHIAMWSRQLTAQEINNLNWATIIGGLQAETTSGRVARKLKTAGWNGTRIINSAPGYPSVEGDPGQNVADLGNEIAGYEDSMMFADAAGQLQYRGRVMSYQQTPRATLGERTDLGEIPYQPGMSPSFNPLFVYNSVEIDNTRMSGLPGFIGGAGSGSIATTTFVAKDLTSDTRYNTRSLQRATRYLLDSDGWHIAWWWLARYAYPQRRVETITISAEAAPERWPLVLSIEVGDIVTVMKRQTNAPAVSFRARVLRVQPDITFGDQTSGSVTLTLGAAPPPVAITGDATLGVLSGTVMGA